MNVWYQTSGLLMQGLALESATTRHALSLSVKSLLERRLRTIIGRNLGRLVEKSHPVTP